METRSTILMISGNAELKAACRQALGPGNFAICSAPTLEEWSSATGGRDAQIALLDAATLP